MLLKTLFLSSKTAESMMVIPALPKYMQYYDTVFQQSKLNNLTF